MPKGKIDYSDLEARFAPKTRYKLADVAHRIEKVAFDVVRFRDGDEASKLWQKQSFEDGEYIVALYDEPSEKIASMKSLWSVEPSPCKKFAHVFYRGEHVVKLNAAQLGISDVDTLVTTLPRRLAANKEFSAKLLKQATPEVQKYMVAQYPELAAK
jgi:hypothetical protein